MKKTIYKKFIFQKYELDRYKDLVRFYYSLDDKIRFVETLKLDLQKTDLKTVDKDLLNKTLFNLHLVMGISYWKTYCPKEMVVDTGSLNKKQAQFWNKLYTKGMGEFYYKNKIDLRNLVNFPCKNIKKRSIVFKAKKRSLVPVGGGKDSIVTAELLKESEKDFTLFSLSDSKIQKGVTKIIGKERIVADRLIDKKLFELNKQGCYNGHTPVSAIYSFTALLTCVLYNYKYIIFSNEQSANQGNTRYLGQDINHQYSKTLEFETDFNNYVHQFVTPDIHCFSLLRPFSELKIVEIFSKYEKYFSVFSSCNKNFKMSGKITKRWCGKCAKCSFVFSQLSAFLPKKKLVKIFNKDLYADKSLLDLYLELLGAQSIKPFDCVGTPDEVKAAMYLALQKGEFNDDMIMKHFNKNILPKMELPKKMADKILSERGAHNIPKEFQNIIDKI